MSPQKKDLEALLAELRDGTDAAQRAALRSLPQELPRRALAQVLEVFRRSSQASTREIAAGILGRKRFTEAIPSLVKAIIWGASDAHAAAAALAVMGSPAGEPICEAVAELRRKFGHQSFRLHLGFLNPDERDETVRALRLLTRTLVSLALPETVPTLTALALAHPDPIARRLAVPGLAHIGTAPAADALRRILLLRLESDTPATRDLTYLHEIQERAAKALGELGDRVALGPLAELLPIEALGKTAAQAIARITAPENEALQHALGYFFQGWGRPHQVAFAEAIPALCLFLERGDAELRLRSAEALEHLARNSPTPHLKQAIAPLRRRSRAALEEGPERTAYFARVLECVEAAEEVTNLPLPAQQPPPDGRNLPRPSSG